MAPLPCEVPLELGEREPGPVAKVSLWPQRTTRSLSLINSCASALEKLNDRLARRGVISELDDLKMRALSTGRTPPVRLRTNSVQLGTSDWSQVRILEGPWANNLARSLNN